MLDPGLRRDDVLKAIGSKIVIPALAAIQCLYSLGCRPLSQASLP